MRFLKLALFLSLLNLSTSFAVPYSNCDCNMTWVTEYPWPTSSSLRSIYGTSCTDVWSVGDSGTLIHYDGASWTKISSKFDNSTFRFNYIWGNRSYNYWALRWDNQIGLGRHSLYRYNGSSWREEPGPNRDGIYLEVLEFSDDSVLLSVFRDFNDYCVYTWTAQSGWTPNCNDCFGAGLWGLSIDDYWNAGGDTVCHVVDGQPIERIDGLPPSFSIRTLIGFSNSDIWGAGDHIYHWDGQSWSQDPVQAPSYINLACSIGSHLWAIADNRWIFHYNDQNWNYTPYPYGGDTFRVNDIWGATNTDVWAVGSGGVILHYDGTDWTYHNVEKPNPSFERLFVLDENNRWASTYFNEIFYSDGNSWRFVPEASGYEIWASSADNVWTSGFQNYLNYFNGSTWTQITIDINGSYVSTGGVYSSNVTNVYVTGEDPDSGNPLLCKWDGRTWESISLPNGVTYAWFLWGSGGDDVWMNTNLGWLHYIDNSWQDYGLPDRGIGGSSPTNIWFSGLEYFEFFNGVQKQRFSFPDHYFNWIDSSDPNDVYLKEWNLTNSIMRWDGTSLESVIPFDGYIKTLRENEILITDGKGIHHGYCRGQGQMPGSPAEIPLAGYWDTHLDNSGGRLNMTGLLLREDTSDSWEDIQVSIDYEGIPTGLFLSPINSTGNNLIKLFDINLPVSGPLTAHRILLELVVKDNSFVNSSRRWPYLEVK